MIEAAIILSASDFSGAFFIAQLEKSLAKGAFAPQLPPKDRGAENGVPPLKGARLNRNTRMTFDFSQDILKPTVKGGGTTQDAYSGHGSSDQAAQEPLPC